MNENQLIDYYSGELLEANLFYIFVRPSVNDRFFSLSQIGIILSISNFAW